jgi:formylglycine-generating enzyme required for sulfatase activity
LTIEEVFKQTRVGVQGKSYRKQTPWDASSLTGNFYFNPSELSSAEKIPKNEEPKIKTSEEPQVKIKVPTKTDDMMWVEGGWFEMGSNDGSSDEKPVHRVYIDGFYIGKYEVSQSEYEKVMGTNPSNYKCPTCPVDYVTYNEAIIFANKVGKRLPTEAEWEYAARGGGKSNNYKFSGSDNLDDVGWYYSNAGGRTHAVGTKRANELGIYDMSGNVWEWCSDFYGWSYYEGSAEKNPQGPSSGTDRMLRGGSFLNSDFFVRCRATGRNWCEPNCRSTDYGFRCVQDEKIRVEDEVKKKVGEGLKKLFKKP